ncbi:hypothetical protein GGR56DRAFT_227465 [Xylariaceae sp. FL0804]|nr:hypothetical protein GGR56DRAFT_227465 [Xylariaceae sp. FL0804]
MAPRAPEPYSQPGTRTRDHGRGKASMGRRHPRPKHRLSRTTATSRDIVGDLAPTRVPHEVNTIYSPLPQPHDGLHTHASIAAVDAAFHSSPVVGRSRNSEGHLTGDVPGRPPHNWGCREDVDAEPDPTAASRNLNSSMAATCAASDTAFFVSTRYAMAPPAAAYQRAGGPVVPSELQLLQTQDLAGLGSQFEDYAAAAAAPAAQDMVVTLDLNYGSDLHGGITMVEKHPGDRSLSSDFRL